METQKLSVKAFAKASGLLWGSAVLCVGLANLAYPDYGKLFLDMMGSLYLWHPASPSLVSVLILGGLAVLDGVIAGIIFSLLYNACLHCCHKGQD